MGVVEVLKVEEVKDGGGRKRRKKRRTAESQR